MAMFDKVKAAASAVGNWTGELVSAGIDKLETTINEVIAVAPHLEKVGYRLGEIEMELSLSPGVVIHLLRECAATDEAFQAALLNHKDSKTFCTIVKLIQQAEAVHSRIQLQGRQFRTLEVHLGLSPAVRMRYAEPATPSEEQTTRID